MGHCLRSTGGAQSLPSGLGARRRAHAKLLQIDRLAVDTHGYTDVAMGLAKLLGFSLCPRLAMLRDRKLYVPHNKYVSTPLREVTVRMSIQVVKAQWD